MKILKEMMDSIRKNRGSRIARKISLQENQALLNDKKRKLKNNPDEQ